MRINRRMTGTLACNLRWYCGTQTILQFMFNTVRHPPRFEDSNGADGDLQQLRITVSTRMKETGASPDSPRYGRYSRLLGRIEVGR